MREGGGPRLIADGGASAEAPEHTIAAYELALRQGADALWLDVHCARDHRAVIVRDFTLERTTDGAGPVAEYDVRALKRLDAGASWGPAFAGQRIQTLEEVLERFRGRAGFVLALRGGLQCYPEIADRAVGLVQVYGVRDESVLVSADAAALREVVRLDADLIVGSLLVAGGGSDEQAPGIAAVALAAPLLTPARLAALAAERLACYALRVVDGAEAVRLARAGVRGIVTDRPGRLAARLGR